MTGTWTSEGVIPHLRVDMPSGESLLAPVKLILDKDQRGAVRVAVDYTQSMDRRLPKPLRRDGRLVFALPGGGEIEGG